MDGSTRVELIDHLPMPEMQEDWLEDDISLTEEPEIAQVYVSNGKEASSSDPLGFGQGGGSHIRTESSDKNAAVHRRAPTQQQKCMLVEFLEKYPALARGRVKAQKKFRAQQLWRSIAERLNNSGSCQKTVNQWRKFWVDLLRRVRTAKRDGRLSDLDPWDRRMLAFVGDNYNSERDLEEMELPEPAQPDVKPPVLAATVQQPRFIRILPKPTMQGTTLLIQAAAVNSLNSTANQKSFQVPTLRPTQQQKFLLLEFLRKFPALARGRLKGDEQRRGLRLWKVATERLNTAGGCVKTRKGWQKFWQDSIRNLYKRRESASLYANKQLDVWDKSVLSLLGDDFQPSGGSAPEDAGETEEPSSETQEGAESVDAREDNATAETSSLPSLRLARPSYVQKLMLAEFLEQHPALARGQLKHKNYHRAAHMWARFADRLNAAEGCAKLWSQWRKFWSDRRLHLLTMYKRYRRELQANPDAVSPFNEWETRMLTLLVPDMKPPLKVGAARRQQPAVVKVEVVPVESHTEGKMIEVELECGTRVSKVERVTEDESDSERDGGGATLVPAHLNLADVRTLIEELRRSRELQEEQLEAQRLQAQELQRLREAVQYQGDSINNLIQEIGKRFESEKDQNEEKPPADDED